MYRRRVAATAALALSITSLTPFAAHAASSGASTYYVSTNGSVCDDTGPGTEAEPFCTITAAAATATTPGDTVLIEPGTYGGEVQITASGTAADPITFEAASPEANGWNVSVEPNSNSQAYGLYLNGASYIDLSGISFTGGSSTGISANIADSSHIAVSHVYSSGADVRVTEGSSDVTLSRVWAQGSSGGSAIDVDSDGTGNVITTSVVTAGGNGAAGITVSSSPNAVITGNTVTQYCDYGIAVDDGSDGDASGATIENNVIEDAVTDSNDEGSCAAATTAGIYVQSTADEAGLTANYNDVYPADSVNTEAYDWAGIAYQTPAALYAATGQGAADSIANPQVALASGLVENESSPVINGANSNAPDEPSTDFLGNARVYDPNVAETGAGTPGYDRGAYQYVETLSAGHPAVPSTAPSGAAVTIDAPSMTDNWANATYTYVYDFGDGTSDVTTSGTTVTHTYASPGDYTATVTVTSDYGASTASGFTIDVLKPVTFAASVTGATDFGLSVDPSVSVTTDWPVTSQRLDYGDGTSINVTSVNDTDLIHTYAEPGTYTLTYTVTDAGGDSKTVTDAFTTAGSDFTPIEPTRLLDTRKDLGGTSGELANDGSITLKIAGVDGIPANVTAVDLNLTAVNATGGGYIEANTGTNNGTSNLNYGKSLIYSNSVIARVGADGTVTLRNFAGTTATTLDLIADLTGYFSTGQADRFQFVGTSRIMDTRSGTGGSTGALAAGKTDVLTVDGAGDLPASGITAVSVNLTVTDTTNAGYLVVYADGAPVPGTSDVNWQGATTKATNVLIPVGSNGKIDVYNRSGDGGVAEVVMDVTGYFSASTTGDVYVPVTPARVLDTRKSSPIAALGSLSLNLGGVDGMPYAPIPDEYPYLDQSLDGYVLNATATDTEQAGWLLLSDGLSGTSTSTVNWTGPGQTVANLAITHTVPGNLTEDPGEYFVSFYNGSLTKPVQAIADVMGYFTAS